MNLNLAIDEQALRVRLERTFNFGVTQLEKMLPKWTSDKPAPIYTENGVWSRPDFIWTDWCPGFYAGMMWLAYERTRETKWREGILQHGVYHKPMNWGVDESVMWGDYFFMEALHTVLTESM